MPWSASLLPTATPIIPAAITATTGVIPTSIQNGAMWAPSRQRR
jgi:hypothetical protein